MVGKRSSRPAKPTAVDEMQALRAFADDMSGEVFPLMKPLAAEKVRETVEAFLKSLGRPELAVAWRSRAG